MEEQGSNHGGGEYTWKIPLKNGNTQETRKKEQCGCGRAGPSKGGRMGEGGTLPRWCSATQMALGDKGKSDKLFKCNFNVIFNEIFNEIFHEIFNEI